MMSKSTNGNALKTQNISSLYSRQNSSNETHELVFSRGTSADEKIIRNGGGNVRQFMRIESGSIRPQLYRITSAFNSSTVKYMFIAAVVLVLILFAVVCVLTGFLVKCETRSHSEKASVVVAGQDFLCFPCGDAGIPGVRVVFKTLNGVCCVRKDQEDFKEMSERRGMIPIRSEDLLTAKENIIRINCADGKTSASSAKRPVTAALVTLNTALTKKNHTLQWTDKSQNAFVMGDVTFFNNTLCLKRNGLVRLHSHFSLDTVNNKLVTGNNQFVTHAIFGKSRDGSNKSLALERLDVKKSSYLSADLQVSVRVRKNDCVYSYFSEPHLIYDMPISNFFEILMIT